MKKRNFIVLTILFMFFCISSCINASSDNIDVSVIVPIYNVEKYLDECLNSIENQTKKDGVEIICVNDGSKDKSAEILKNHADKNDKIKVITQENRGLSAARNEGMKIAKGKYIMFVDSDDLLFPYAIEKAFQNAEKYNADILKFSHVAFRDGINIVLSSYKYDDSKVYFSKREENQNPFEVWKKYNIYPMVWSKIWKRDFLEKNNLTFKEGLKMEDILFNFLSLPKISEITINGNPLYAYRVARKDSIVYDLNRNSLDKLKHNLVISEEIVNNRDIFNFKDSDNWIVSSIISRYYNGRPRNLKIKSQKTYYSDKFLNLIDEFIKKYDVIVSEENKTKIDNLRKVAKNI